MAFFEDLGKKVSKISSDTVKKTKDLSETARLTSLINMAEKEEKELYAQIGRMYYENYNSEPEEMFSDLINSVREKKQLINEYNEQIKNIKGVVHCEKCGAEVSAQAIFCSVCGSKMPKNEKENQEDGIICPQCGAILNETHVFCTTCGYKLNKEEKSMDVEDE